MAHACPTLEPALECSGIRPTFKRRTFPSWRLAVTVRRHAARAMEQREIGFLLWQHGQEIGERRDDRETNAPAVTVLRPEQRDLARDVGKRHTDGELTMHGLGDYEPEVVCKAVRKSLTPVRGRIGVSDCGLHPNFAIAQFDREGRDVVRPQVKSAAAFEIEAGVMPMTGQDAVLDAAPLQWETHVRAPIVEGEDATAVVNNEDRAMTAMQDDPALRPELLKAAGANDFLHKPFEVDTLVDRIGALLDVESVATG